MSSNHPGREITGFVARVKSLIGLSESPTECKHVQYCKDSSGTFPDEDASIWYVIEKRQRKDPRWSETDAAYLKLQDITTEYVCLGCGATREVHSAERIGGRDGIKLKSDMDGEELSRFKREVHGGGFYNGFPDDHPMADGGSNADTVSEGDLHV